MNIDRITDAIAVFEETLITPNSRFDQWLRGNDDAITVTEKEGYELFKNSGCVACHYGEGIGGSSFQKMGLSDNMFFKVPTLRNVVLTYPYFHDGQVNTLEEATQIMGKLQLGRHFTPEEVEKIVAFYGTLTGDQPQLMMPILPASNNNTPLPKPFSQE